MSDYMNWWANRAGQYAAATVTPSRPQPEAGAALELATAPLATSQHAAAVNDIQYVRDEEDRELSNWEKIKQGIGGVASGVFNWAGDRAEDVGEIREATREAVLPEGFLQASEDVEQAGREVVGRAGERVLGALETADRAIATPMHAAGVADQGGHFWETAPALFEGETWKEAWERAENASFGQSIVDALVYTPQQQAEAHAAGFDEDGRPRNKGYAELRSGVAYNIASGSLDFAKAFLIAPEVVVAKGVGVARAVHKIDLPRLGIKQQARVRHILATPQANLPALKADTPTWDVLGRQAIKAREEQFRLRDEIRAGNLDVQTLAGYQAFDASAQGPVAAHLYAAAATTKKFDPNAGVFTDEFDDDTFDLVSAALVGHTDAIKRLTQRHSEVGDAVNAVTDRSIAAIDEVTKWGEEVLDIQTTPGLSEAAVKERLVMPEANLKKAEAEAELVEQSLRQYHGYEDWLNRAVGEGAQPPALTMAPREAYGIGQNIRGATAITYRPTGTAKHGATVVKMPRAMWRQLPGNANLHSGEETFTSAARFLDQAAFHGRQGDLHGVAQRFGAADWNTLKADVLNKVAAASTDVERRAYMNEVEDIAVAAIARRHGLEPAEARHVTRHVRGMRENVMREAQEQAVKSYSRATGPNGKRVAAFKHKNADGSVTIAQLPIDPTQLQNTFIGLDLRAMDQMLDAHGGSVKAMLRRGLRKGTQPATELMEYFNFFWKPAVLFRLGYPVRNLTDDGLRAVGAMMSFSYMIGSTKAIAQGVANVPVRGYNAYAKTANMFRRARHPELHDALPAKLIKESLGPVDEINPERLARLHKQTTQVKKWERTGLNRKANGKPAPPPPKSLTRLQESLANVTDEITPINGVTGKAQDTVGGKWETIIDDSVATLNAADPLALSRYITQNADILSNKGNAVLVRKTGENAYEVSVGRRNLYANRPQLLPLKQPKKSATGIQTRRGYEFEESFGPTGDMYRPMNSSEPWNRDFRGANEFILGKLRKDNLQVPVHPGQEKFEEGWAAILNNEFRHSPILRRMLDGCSDQEIITWMKTTPGGRQVVKRFPHKAHNPVKWVDELRAHYNHYVPSNRIRNMVAKGEVDVGELTKLGPWEPRPAVVDAPAVADASGGSQVGRMVNTFIDKTFKALATTPTDTLIRNPFFDRNYNYHIDRMLDTLADDAVITPKMRTVMEGQARQFALKQTKRYMFSMADHSEFTQMLRFVSPFMSAWYESLTRWFRIVAERPEAFARLYVQGWEKGIDALWGVEEDVDPLTGDKIVRIPMPNSVKRAMGAMLPGVKYEDLEGFENFLISKKSMNVTLQGSPWWLPGGGPMLTMPAKFMMENDPDFADENAIKKFAWKWLFPVGMPDKMVDAFLPSWMQQFQRYLTENEDPTFQNLGWLVYKNDMQRWKDAGRVGKAPTPEESWEKAKGVQAFYTASRLGSPFAFRLEPQSQFWIDKSREYIDTYGYHEGLTKFTEEMGDDAYLWTTSLSKSNLSVPATSEGYRQYQRYRKDIEKFPELTDVIVGQEAWDAEFNPEVYNWQQNNPVSPVDPRPQRGQKTAREGIDEIEVKQGWDEYAEWRTAITAELAARGLKSITQKGAEDLAWANDQFVNDQKDKLRAWGRDYEEFDTGKGYEYVGWLRDWIESGAAPMERPDVPGIAEYIEIHDAFAAELDARKTAGQSRNIDAESNQDLEDMWDFAMGELTERNPMFADVYHKHLERHRLLNGSN